MGNASSTSSTKLDVPFLPLGDDPKSQQERENLLKKFCSPQQRIALLGAGDRGGNVLHRLARGVVVKSAIEGETEDTTGSSGSGSNDEDSVDVSSRDQELCELFDALITLPKNGARLNPEQLQPVLLAADAESRRPIHIATMLHHSKLARTFLTLCPRVCECTDLKGRNAVAFAITSGNADVVQAILEHTGSEELNSEIPFFLGTDGGDDRASILTQVCMVVCRSALNRVKRNMSSNASKQEDSVNPSSNRSGRDPPSESQLKAILDVLLSNQNLKLETCCPDRLGALTPLHLFVHERMDHQLQKLVDAGANVNVTDYRMRTPFFEAVADAYVFGARLLARAKSCVWSCRDAAGDNILHALGRASCNQERLKDALKLASWLHTHGQHQLRACLQHRNHEGFDPLSLPGIPDDMKDRLRAFADKSDDNDDDKSGDVVQFQICSDLHIEFFESDDDVPDFVEPACKYLCLLGDIGLATTDRYEKFLLRCANRFQKVFVITGNHEYYDGTITEVDERIRRICKKHDALEFLNARSMVIDGVRVIGCTLWSFIPEEVRDEVSMGLSDFRKVMRRPGEPFTPSHLVELHSEHVAFINKELRRAEKKGQRSILLTHHAPVSDMGTSRAEYYGTSMNSCFCTDLRSLLGASMKVAAYGHTHWPHDMDINGTRLISNPRGYNFKGTRTPYNERCVVDV